MKGSNWRVASTLAICFFVASQGISRADHLALSQCYQYFLCVLGEESALNRCYDNKYLKNIGQGRTMCMKIEQHECKVNAGIQGTGKKLTVTRPLNWYERPTILDKEAQPNSGGDQDIRIYNYAGWNHCPYTYQGLQDFWCDPQQLRYPPMPWCDVLPIYNISLPDPSG